MKKVTYIRFSPLLWYMIYVVDDGADYRFLLQQLFKRYFPSYPVRFFADGDELRTYINRQGDPPRVILLDLNMPVLNGHQTLLFLRQQPGWRYIPVVMMSNLPVDREIRDCYEAGANSFLVKPSDMNELRQRIESVCRYWLDINQIPAVPVYG